MVKILVADYDNTFYTDKNQLYKNIESIKEFQDNGNLFVISTSRSWKSMKKEIDTYKIPFDYLCCNTGGSIFDHDGDLLYMGNVDDDILNKTENILSKYNDKDYSITRYGIYKEYDEKIDKLLGYKIKGDKTKLEKLKDILENDLDKDFQVVLKNEKDYSKLFLNYKLNTKENGIEKLIDFLPKNDYKIITVGDDDVDFNMIKKYDGYRMENSSDLLNENIDKKVGSVFELVELNLS